MGVKDNFSQAFKEILAKAVQDEEQRGTMPEQPTDAQSKFAMPEPVSQPIPQPAVPAAKAENTAAFSAAAKPEINNKPDPFDPVKRGVEMELNDMMDLNTAETTTISKGTSIVGEIKSDSNVTMLGTIQGNIETTGDVRICGKVAGNVKGNNIELTACAIQGDVIATSAVKMDSETIAVGNITASTVEIDGKLKGNVQVENTATIKKNALLVGNLSSAQISVHEGAKIHGEVKITMDQASEKLFEQAMPL